MAVNKFDPDQIWYDWFMTDAFADAKSLYRFLKILPHDPRCKVCHAPFKGIGGAAVRMVYGRRQSSLNPNICSMCEDFAQNFPGGSEVEMSMLFVDVRGSTALSEQMTAMEFQKLINRFYIESTKIIVNDDGLVEKLAGDAVAAFWGAGFAGQDYVAKTVRVAQKIQIAMKKESIPVGVGVHAGVAYFGAMGASEGLIDISAIGDEVNTAARIASKAAEGEILVSEQAIEQAGINKDGLELRSLELKGISEQVPIWVIRS